MASNLAPRTFRWRIFFWYWKLCNRTQPNWNRRNFTFFAFWILETRKRRVRFNECLANAIPNTRWGTNAAYAITANPHWWRVCECARALINVCVTFSPLGVRRQWTQAAAHTHTQRRARPRPEYQRRRSASMVFVCTFLFKPVNANMHTGTAATTSTATTATTHKFQCIGFAVGSGKSRRAAKRLVFFLLFCLFSSRLVYYSFSFDFRVPLQREKSSVNTARKKQLNSIKMKWKKIATAWHSA